MWMMNGELKRRVGWMGVVGWIDMGQRHVEMKQSDLAKQGLALPTLAPPHHPPAETAPGLKSCIRAGLGFVVGGLVSRILILSLVQALPSCHQ